MTLHWINPLALVGLAAAALPIVIHLLRRQRAARVPFPTLRFLTDSRAAAVRLRSLSDPMLLILRVAAIVAAVLAAAQPQLLTAWQRARADARTSRAIVVNRASTSEVGPQRDEAAALERRGSDAVIDIPGSRIGASLCGAAAALLEGPVARHEIVAISDFRHGEVTEADLACVPPDVGLRFVQIAGGRSPKNTATFAGLGPEGRQIQQQVEFDGPRTRVTATLGAVGEAGIPSLMTAPGDADSAARMLRAVARAGAPAMSPEHPIAFVFPGHSSPAVTALRAPWMLATLVAARESETMQRAAAAHRGTGQSSLPREWTPVVRASNGIPVVSAAAAGDRFIVGVAAGPADLLSVVAVRAVLTASALTPDWNGLEPERIPASQLKAWTRPAASIPPERFRPTAPGDARWLWAVALALLCVEWIARRDPVSAERSEVRAA